MITLSPKQRFLKTPAAKSHADLVVAEWFQEALSAALLQMQYDEGTYSDTIIAAATSHRLDGARTFIHKLLNLCEPEPKPKELPKQNLPHLY